MLRKALATHSTLADVRQLFRVAVALATLLSFAAMPCLAGSGVGREPVKRAHAKKSNKSSPPAGKKASSAVVAKPSSHVSKTAPAKTKRKAGAAKKGARVVQAPPAQAIAFGHNTLVDFSFTSGEPFINAAPITVAPNTPAGSPFISVPFGFSTTVSLLWKSIDGGRSFIQLGSPIVRDAIAGPGGGDTHQYFDSLGRFYYADLSAGCVTTAVSDDGGNTFPKINPVSCIGPGDPGGAQDDRQWTGAFGDGRGYMTVRNLAVSVGGNFHLNRTRDAGQTWLAAQPIGSVTQSGPLVVDKMKRNIGGTNYILPWQIYYSGQTLKAFRFKDPDTGGAVSVDDITLISPGHSVSTVFPVMALDVNGNVYAVWSNTTGIFMTTCTNPHDPSPANVTASCSPAKRVSHPPPAPESTGTLVMPWIIAGDPGRVDVVWYRSSMPGNSTNPNNRWDIWMAQSLNALDASPTWEYTKVNEHNIHFGEICLAGLNCDLAVPPGSRDRSFLEFPSVTIDHRGAAMVTWNDNTNQSAVTAAAPQVTGAAYVMFSKQNCGPSLYASVGELGEAGTVGITSPSEGQVFTAPTDVTVQGTHTLPPKTFDRDEAGDGRFPDHGAVIGANVPALDLRQVDMTDTDASELLQVHMRLADSTTAALASAGGPLVYLTQWDYDASEADPIDRVYWVAAEVQGGQPIGRTGTLGVVRSATSKKFITYNPDAMDSLQVVVTNSNSAVNGTITLAIPKALVGNPPPGAQLKSVTGYAMRGTLAAPICPEPPASCENFFNPASLPVQVDAAGAFTYIMGGGLQHDGVVELSLDDPTFSSPIAPSTMTFNGTWTHTFTNVSVGPHTVYSRQVVRGCATSPTVSRTFTVQGTAVRTNYALSLNGGSALASTSHATGLYPASAANNGDRIGNNWGTVNGGWNDGTRSAYPDILEVNFVAPRLIDEINVVTLQNNWVNSGEPSLTTSANAEGILDFDVEYWNGSAWVDIASVTGNDKAWRQFMFAAVTTTKIRVVINNARNNWSRLVEVEAIGAGGQ